MAATSEGEEKIRNVICYFALEHERRTHKPLSGTCLYDYMLLLDSASIERTGHPALDPFCQRREMDLLLAGDRGKGEKLTTDRFVIISQGENGCIVRATRKPDLHCFSVLELTEMKKLVRTYAHQFAKTADTCKGASGTPEFLKRITGRGANENIGYRDVFNDGFITKHDEEKVTMSSLHALTEKYVTQVKELETRLAEVRHKLEVVMEASRLLAEEGLSDDYSANRFGQDRT